MGATMLTIAGCNSFNFDKPVTPDENASTTNTIKPVEDNISDYVSDQSDLPSNEPSIPKCLMDYLSDRENNSVVGEFDFNVRGYDQPFHMNNGTVVGPNGRTLLTALQIFTFDVNDDGHDDFIYAQSSGSGVHYTSITIYDYSKNSILYSGKTNSTYDYMCHIFDDGLRLVKVKSNTYFADQEIYGVASFIFNEGLLRVRWENYFGVNRLKTELYKDDAEQKQIDYDPSYSSLIYPVEEDTSYILKVIAVCDDATRLPNGNVIAFSDKDGNIDYHFNFVKKENDAYFYSFKGFASNYGVIAEFSGRTNQIRTHF